MTDLDTTGWCARNEHHHCDGTLRAGTGSHWFCACRCHPEPTPHWHTEPEARAIATWRLAHGGNDD